MVKIKLEIKADLSNITDLVPGSPDYAWNFIMKCTHCQEQPDNFITLCATDEVEIHGSRGSANYVSRCKFCKREGVCSLLEGPFPYPEDKNNKYFGIAVFDCRGIEPVEFRPDGEWKAVGLDSGTSFSEIEIIDNEWADYDEKAGNEVSIMELESRFAKV